MTHPDYNLATVNAEAILAICHRANVLQIWNADGVPSAIRNLDKEFRQLAARLGYVIETTERMTPPKPQALDELSADEVA